MVNCSYILCDRQRDKGTNQKVGTTSDLKTKLNSETLDLIKVKQTILLGTIINLEVVYYYGLWIIFLQSCLFLERRQPKASFNEMDGSHNHVQSKRTVFVTVGTTSFDSLVTTIDTNQVKEELSKKGYTHLVIQMGRGSYIPIKCSGEDGSLVVEYFTFCSSIANYLRSASLVISHAGSGSIFEALRLAKPLIVVVNEDLMDNHQSELAEELAERKHLLCARPQTLYQVIESLDLESVVPYQPGDGNPVAKLINRHLGFPAD